MAEETLIGSGDVGSRGALMVEERAISKKMLIAKKDIELIRYKKI